MKMADNYFVACRC